MTLCACGCGQKTPLRTRNRETGPCGEPIRFVLGHSSKKHGLVNSPTYRSWSHMVNRCTNPKNDRWKSYGGAGIKVCDRWKNSFELFFEDMGERPDGTSLDRFPNKTGNYEPGNCRWATPLQQQNNMIGNVILTHEGVTATISEWAQKIGVKKNTLVYRLRRGWTLERALTGKCEFK